MLSLLSYLKAKYIELIRFAGDTYNHIQKHIHSEYIGIHPTAELRMQDMTLMKQKGNIPRNSS